MSNRAEQSGPRSSLPWWLWRIRSILVLLLPQSQPLLQDRTAQILNCSLSEVVLTLAGEDMKRRGARKSVGRNGFRVVDDIRKMMVYPCTSWSERYTVSAPNPSRPNISCRKKVKLGQQISFAVRPIYRCNTELINRKKIRTRNKQHKFWATSFAPKHWVSHSIQVFPMLFRQGKIALLGKRGKITLRQSMLFNMPYLPCSHRKCTRRCSLNVPYFLVRETRLYSHCTGSCSCEIFRLRPHKSPVIRP